MSTNDKLRAFAIGFLEDYASEDGMYPMKHYAKLAYEAIDASKPEQHPDDAAVDRFAQAMKEKLAIAREKGRSGWQECDPNDLSLMLRDHVEKGDPRDVANFCMFLWNLGAGITDGRNPLMTATSKPEPQAQAGEPIDIDSSSMDSMHWAKAFASRFTVWSQKYGVESDTAGLMLVWFANAIMAGYDNAINRSSDAIAKRDAALDACVEAAETVKRWLSVCGVETLNINPVEVLDAAITQAQEARK